MDAAEMATFVMDMFDDLRDCGVEEVEKVILVIRDTDGVVAYRTTNGNTEDNIGALARAIGIETGYLESR